VAKGLKRRLRYSVAMSLDGFIARPDGSFDWIVSDPAIDFAAMFKEYDAAVMGRKTWDVAAAMGEQGVGSMETWVFSRTLPTETRKKTIITGEDPVAVVRELKQKPGKDIWLFGGGQLFHTLLGAGLVDTVEVAVIPVLLGGGLPVLPPGVETTLRLEDHRVLPTSGIVMLAYSVPGCVAPASKIRHVRKATPKAKPKAKPKRAVTRKGPPARRRARASRRR